MTIEISLAALVEERQYIDIRAIAIATIITSLYLFFRGKFASGSVVSLADPSMASRPNIVKGPFSMGEVRVSKILVHPIKSCRGTSVSEARYTPSGIENDRKWCIIDAKTNDIITARDIAKLVLIDPRLEYDPSSPYRGNLAVTIPSNNGATSFSIPIEPTKDILASWSIIENCTMFGQYKIDGYICQSLQPEQPSPSQLLSEYLGKDAHLVMKGPAIRACIPTPAFPDLKADHTFQDGYPLLVASEESVASVGASIQDAATGQSAKFGKIGGLDGHRWKDGQIEIERFRPNIVVKGAGVPFAEDAWLKISIGDVSSGKPSEHKLITLVSKCARCLLPNVDTKRGVRDAAVPYKIMMKVRTGVDPENMSKPCFGCNGVPGGTGVVRVGDLVTVHEWLS